MDDQPETDPGAARPDGSKGSPPDAPDAGDAAPSDASAGEASADEGRRGGGRSIWLLALGAGLVVLVLGVAVSVGAVVTRRAGSGDHPNVLMIMTDDQTLEEMRALPRTKQLIADQGTTFDEYYVSFPVCCPSRATYYSGQYAHNNGVKDNVPPLGGALKFVPHENDTLAVWMQKAGYQTASIGKYLNGWGEDGNIAPPPGWSHWFGLIDPSTYNYFNYSVSLNGQRYDYGTKPEDYQTDVLGQEVVNTITRFGQQDSPWFVSFTPLAPHVGGREGTKEIWSTAVPAPRHEGIFRNEPLPVSPSYDEADVSKKPAFVRNLKPLDDNAKAAILGNYQKELEALQAVDEWVEKIVTTLQQTGQLDNTVIVFTSDNGLFHGQHRNLLGKVQLYEESSHVPLVIRGASFPAGAHASQVTANVDLAPTILKLAGATATVPLDGRDLAPVATNPTDGADRSVLLENWNGLTGQSSTAIRGGRWFYAEHPGNEKELYDLQTDPYQLHNLVDDPAYASVVQSLAPRLAALRTCAGASCEGSDAALGR
ncbi:MAG: sulfatase [Acidimicrobiales bacterium]